MTNEQREAIERHGRKLLAIFPDSTETDPVKLCKKLRRIETSWERIATAYCNGEIQHDTYESHQDKHMVRLDKVLNFESAGVPVFCNGDPRGYGLKIRDEYVRENELDIHTDWGGYGIIAPEIDAKGHC